jgi:hypothetical protein
MGDFVVHLRRGVSVTRTERYGRLPGYLLVVRFRWSEFEGSLGGLYARLCGCSGSVCGAICVVSKASRESESNGRVESSVGGLWGRRLRRVLSERRAQRGPGDTGRGERSATRKGPEGGGHNGSNGEKRGPADDIIRGTIGA